MRFNYSYQKDSLVNSDASQTSMSFAPDTTRSPTFFRGELRQSVAFREAISALHDVVISDLRWQPKDKMDYKEWAANQELIDWASVAAQQKGTAERLEQARKELEAFHIPHSIHTKAQQELRPPKASPSQGVAPEYFALPNK